MRPIYLIEITLSGREKKAHVPKKHKLKYTARTSDYLLFKTSAYMKVKGKSQKGNNSSKYKGAEI